MVMLLISEEKARLMSGSTAGFGCCCVGWCVYMGQLGNCLGGAVPLWVLGFLVSFLAFCFLFFLLAFSCILPVY